MDWQRLFVTPGGGGDWRTTCSDASVVLSQSLLVVVRGNLTGVTVLQKCTEILYRDYC